MAKDVVFSPVAPFKLVPADNTKPTGIHSGSLDREWFVNLQDPRDTVRQYFQRVETTDRLRHTFSASTHTSRTLTIIDANGTVVATISSPLTTVIPGNIDADGSAMTTYLYKKTDFSGLSGIYFLKLSITWLDATVQEWISEPFKVAERHPGTVRVDYWNLTNRDAVYYEQLPCRFQRRILAKVSNMTPGAAATNYKDQLQDETQLYRESFRTWTLSIGHDTTGIPDYESDLVSRIFNSSNVYIDDKQYKLADGAAFTRSNTGDLYGVTTEIKEVDGLEGFHYKANKLTVYVSPGAYPYMLASMTIGGTFVAGPVRIADSTAEAAFITATNASISNAELTGTLSLASGVISYTLGAGEQFTTAAANIITTKFQFGYTPSSGPYTLTLQFAQASGVISWATGVLQTFSVSGTTNIAHTYPSAPIATVEVWTTFCKQFGINNPATSSFTGTLPANMETFTLQGTTFPSNTFNFSLVAPCAAVLKTLALSSCGLVAANNMPSYAFPLLTYVNFAANSLPQTVMNLLIQDVKNNAYASAVYNGALNVSTQSPPVLLNPTGTAAKTALQAYGWSVIN